MFNPQRFGVYLWKNGETSEFNKVSGMNSPIIVYHQEK